MDNVMERELSVEAMLSMIAGNSLHTDSFDTLDRLMQVSERTAADVWVYLEAALETSAKQHGWLAVKNRLASSELHAFLKDRVMAKVNAGIFQDDLAKQTKKVEDLIVSSIADTSLEARARMIVRRLVGKCQMVSADMGISNLLARLSDPEVVDMLCKQAIGMAKLSDQELAEQLGDAERIDSISANKFLAARSVDEQHRMVEDLFVDGVDPAMQERVRYVVRTMVCKDFDARKLLGNLYDPSVFAQLRAKVMILAEMPLEGFEMAAEMRAARNELKEAKTFPKDVKLMEDIEGELNFLLETMKTDVKVDLPPDAAEKMADVIQMAKQRLDSSQQWTERMLAYKAEQDAVLLQREKMAKTRRVADAVLREEAKAKAAAEAKAQRAADALLRDEAQAKAAAEAKAKRVADALLRDEAKAKEAAERRADKAMRAKSDERIRQERVAKERDDAKAARAAEAHRAADEKEARRAIELVEARCAAEARRAAARAAKKEKKQARLAEEAREVCDIFLFFTCVL
jgi:hypothetical protein